jgi:LPXTG-motif cell wall-anchored protein
MDLLLLPHWLMIAGAALVALGFLGLVFARNKQAATNPDSELNVPPSQLGG